MINIKPQIDALLNTIENVSVHYFYPDSFATLPVISYKIANDSTVLTLDGEERLEEITLAIDVWDMSAVSDLSKQVNDLMNSIGFKRVSAIDLYDTETKIDHKLMQFKAVIDTKTELVYN